MDRSIPVFLKVVCNLIIENREAIKMNMATDLMKVKVYVSTIYSRTQPRRMRILRISYIKYIRNQMDSPYIIARKILHCSCILFTQTPLVSMLMNIKQKKVSE